MNRSWRRPSATTTASLMHGALLLFVAAAFLLPTEPAYALVFYAALPLATFRPRALLRAPAAAGGAGPALACALIVWSGLTLVWGHDDGHRSFRFAVSAACTLVFFLMVQRAWLGRPSVWRPLGTVLIWSGAANAALSVTLGLVTPQHSDRLHGWGVTSHPILGASVMTLAYLAALCRALDGRRVRPGYVMACAVMALFIVLTESRGPWLAALATTAVICAASPWRWAILAGTAALSATWFVLPAKWRHHGAHIVVYRGSSHRFEIWRRTLQMVAHHPLLGNGLAANLDLPGLTFPHDLYLSVLFYSGAVGFLLFLALAAAVTRQLWRGRRAGGQGWLWMVALWINTLLSGLTDLGQITKGPGPMWLIFWLPVGLILAQPACSPDPNKGRLTPPATA